MAIWFINPSIDELAMDPDALKQAEACHGNEKEGSHEVGIALQIDN
jgi:hypothetical protein